MATSSYNQLMSLKIDSFRILEISPRIVTNDDDGVSNTVLMNHVKLTPAPIRVQDVTDYANIGSKQGLSAGEVLKNVRTSQALRQNIIYNKLGQDTKEQNVHMKNALQQSLIYDNGDEIGNGSMQLRTEKFETQENET